MKKIKFIIATHIFFLISRTHANDLLSSNIKIYTGFSQGELESSFENSNRRTFKFSGLVVGGSMQEFISSHWAITGGVSLLAALKVNQIIRKSFELDTSYILFGGQPIQHWGSEKNYIVSRNSQSLCLFWRFSQNHYGISASTNTVDAISASTVQISSGLQWSLYFSDTTGVSLELGIPLIEFSSSSENTVSRDSTARISILTIR